MRLFFPVFAALVLLAPVSAPAASVIQVCKGEGSGGAGKAWVVTKVLDGVPRSTTAEFLPPFHSTIEAVPPVEIPDIAKTDGETPNMGAYPAAKVYYEYQVGADGARSLPPYRLRLEVPVFSGGVTKPAFFKVRVGAWEGGKTAMKQDISGIVGLPDVPIYGVDFEIHASAESGRNVDSPGLEAALPPADHADIEIHEGSASGPLRIKGTIGLATGRERLAAVGAALRAAGASLEAGTCAKGR